MSLRLILGRAGSGKSEEMLEEIRKELEERPMGPPLIYLVPEQAKFQAERALLDSRLPGMIRAQVYSFRRLAQRLFTELGGSTRKPMSRLGVKLVLYRYLLEHRHELVAFRQAVEQPGFGDQLEEIFLEFRRYGVSPEELKASISLLDLEEKGSESLKGKLHDFSLIYKDAVAHLEGKYLDSEETLRLLAQMIPKAPSLRKAEVWVDGFIRFTPREMSVLGALITTVRRVTISLPVDEGGLFRIPALTRDRLQQLAEKSGVPVEVIRWEEKKENGRGALSYLEAHYEELGAPPFPFEPGEISLSEAVNRRAEVEGVARRIREFVRTGKARWREIGVLVGDMAAYGDLIRTLFQDDEIPFFLDERRPMLHHPLVELVRSALEVIREGWPSEALFRMVKTDLFPGWVTKKTGRENGRRALDRLENLILEFGITGPRWKKECWGISTPPERIKEGERLRQWMVRPLMELEQELTQATHVRQRLEAIYRFLIQLKVPEKLEVWMEEEREEGKVEEAREHEQVWQAFLNLLDQMEEGLGEEELSEDLFFNLFEKGLAEQNFALIPPAMDQVLVGTLSRTRSYSPKILFLVGVNDGLIPKVFREEGLLLDQERKSLSAKGVPLSPLAEERLQEEELYLYLALANPRDHLALSYSLADEEGRALQPSSLISRLIHLFPKLRPQLYTSGSLISHPRRTLSHLTVRLREWKKGYPLHPTWLKVYNWFRTRPNWEESLERALGSLFYRNQETDIGRETARRLYGNPLKGSISRLEKYYACPFSHFAAYGLALQERKRFRLELADIGTLYHEALRLLASRIMESGRQWGDLSQDELLQLADGAVEAVSLSLQHEILTSTNRYRYLKGRLHRVVKRTASVLGEQARRSRFETKEIELLFGEGGKLPPLRITLPNGFDLVLEGRIDRVDLAEEGENLYLRILDYKSSFHDLDLGEVYFGLSLQMVAYLDALLDLSRDWLGKEAIPAGILYFHVHHPLLLLPMGAEQARIDKEMTKRFKMRGLLLADQQVIQLMDTRLIQGTSEILPVGRKKDGSFYNSSRVAGKEQFAALRAHVRSLIRQAALEMTEGKVAISPYQYKKKRACTYCLYQSVCQFDNRLEENQPRLLRVKEEKIWQNLLEGGPSQ
ncbi:helicase-exonuclease AddAB subunit AddB [Thermicanus aegyptius]|uniref:helicase-exonuclease AddAB subunit AddB n=1 Tax=Thermicanus aegyptius TaxID=94009 RepID=UPI00048AA2AF|nr:helicase-exonuclease AddAB subunit AddB [Thermicanus aegyptius]